MKVRAIVDIEEVDGDDLDVGAGEEFEFTVRSHPDRDDLVVVAAPKGKQLSIKSKVLLDAIRRCS